MRARWAILNCRIKVILREISLKNKPDELKILSSKSTVPVLITSDREVIDESMKIIDWSINNIKSDKDINLLEAKGNQKIKDLIDQNDNIFKYHLDRYKYSNRYKSINRKEHHIKAHDILMKWDTLIGKSIEEHQVGWIAGNKESIADWSLWPFVRQYRSVEPKEFDNDINLSNLKKWLDYYLGHKLYPLLMKKYSFWEKAKEDCYFPK